MSLGREELIKNMQTDYEATEMSDVLEIDCRNVVFLLENCEITIPEENRFFVNVNCGGIENYIYKKRIEKFDYMLHESGFMDGMEALAYTGSYDFGHTTAEWDSVVKLGIAGLEKRISQYAENCGNDIKKQRFYREISKVYDAALIFMKRAADAARLHGKQEMAEGILKLTKDAPSNLFEAMQTTIIYYVLQQMFDGTILRTFGRIDSLLYPFFIKENDSDVMQMIVDYLQEIDRLDEPAANLPFAIGGTDMSGRSLINELSYLILDAYTKAGTHNVKFHLLCSKNTPDDIIKNALDAVRKGNNSIVFMSDEKIIESIEKLGEEHEDAVNYHVVGCYECGADGEITSSCSARVNIPLALELALNKGKTMLTDKQIGLENDGCFDSYEALYAEFKRQLVYLCSCAMKITDLCEMNFKHVHSAPILSGTYTSSLENGGDIYCDCSAKYNNTSVNAIGIATAVDSLAAIRKAVFEDKSLTLSEFVNILKSNWSGNEPLRLIIKNKFPKFGIGDKKTDAIAKDIANILSDAINGAPNVKGGIYRLGLFSINWRWEFGRKTAASADGRLAGEPLSQNTSASFGADREGATAHLLSVASIDASKTPNGTIVDIDLHSSAVQGKNGLNTLFSTLKTYFELGGFAVHYNVLDTAVLKNAKLNPDKYPNLQVRLCGWNVLFSSLSDKEKDEFIARSIR